MLDSGLLLTPNSHNSEQGAATLPPVDYGPYSFLHSTPTGSRVGRDYGLQGRGYLSSEHFELGPYVQYSRRDFAESGADEQNTQLGLAYWHSKHTFNVKLGYTRQERDGSVDRDQVVLQCQLFFC